jgi:hypothetical protein
LIGVSALATAGAAWALVSARSLHDQIGPGTSHQEAVDINRRIGARNRAGGAALGVAGAALVAGTAMVLWPDSPPVNAVIAGDGLTVGWAGRF